MTNQLLDSLEATFAECLSIARRKNADYAGADDPYANFRAVEQLGMLAERGILVRVMDKLCRINNLIDRPPAVNDESLEDSCNDAINYLAILKGLRQSRG